MFSLESSSADICPVLEELHVFVEYKVIRSKLKNTLICQPVGIRDFKTKCPSLTNIYIKIQVIGKYAYICMILQSSCQITTMCLDFVYFRDIALSFRSLVTFDQLYDLRFIDSVEYNTGIFYEHYSKKRYG